MADILHVHDVFAMTTDSVGVIIPEVIKEFHLNMTVGAVHYAAMSGIAFAGFFLGYLADKLGRKKTITLGSVLFAVNSYLFDVGRSFEFLVILLIVSGRRSASLRPGRSPSSAISAVLQLSTPLP